METQRSFSGIVTGLTLLAFAAAAWADPYMGEYKGVYRPDSVQSMDATAKVVAEGDDVYYRITITATAKEPSREGATIELHGHRNGPAVIIADRAGGYHWQGQIENGRLAVQSEYGQNFELQRLVRKSPNEGLVPPPGAVVLLPFKEGTAPSLSNWTNQEWKALQNGAMQVNKGDTRTQERFGDIQRLHVEFWLPLEPRERGQGRANSGLFLDGLYEVQILDSFGLVETSGDCGSLYSIKRPDVNASLPPETWQTYDIEFRAPRLNNDGSVREPARITVVFNGVKIHDNVQIPNPTADPKAAVSATGPLQLQDHGHPIQFRNIWLVKE
jgi:hypothetical protein